jgi:hypothetical protein
MIKSSVLHLSEHAEFVGRELQLVHSVSFTTRPHLLLELNLIITSICPEDAGGEIFLKWL